ncbi:hypothetical protein E2C01_026190 [Portunus trituberculatus]|uniref:Uncharacterized protein n=1 Tax=Portunus trituberculatus TaxID=210409 RepID=A0A5B7EHG2_PORTR|nr:hypothetical protein [Portunus trituberculatus]
MSGYVHSASVTASRPHTRPSSPCSLAATARPQHSCSSTVLYLHQNTTSLTVCKDNNTSRQHIITKAVECTHLVWLSTEISQDEGPCCLGTGEDVAKECLWFWTGVWTAIQQIKNTCQLLAEDVGDLKKLDSHS